ncbi:glycerol acyltransferase [Dermacoccus nishinomiyaensis]|uniref:Glycerol acyltransferase n=1 Tax=Dermacoccus nishinomiyaensis TaxID=1274 RepID=A0A075JL47_9MICO|nr:lysophospholipid acyltransferase family protein [Dermacoccus nishinomiyaensis]AIF40818.1 glycerol acyltransferase [Dermacoccus nishinomiyaensis]
MELVYPPVLAIARSLFAAQGLKFTLVGSENLPRTGGAVVMMNHLSYMDFTYAGFPAIKQRRVIRFMAKKEVFDHKISGPLMRGMKHIAVERGNGAQSYRDAVAALKRGELVGIFPEETISRSFELKSFKTGGVRMAQEAGVPIVPMILWGSQRVWTKGKPKRLGRTNTPITVAVGEPMTYDETLSPEQNTQRVKDAMQKLLDAARANYPTLSGADLEFLPASMGGTAPTLDEAEADDARIAAERRRKRAEKAAAASSSQG